MGARRPWVEAHEFSCYALSVRTTEDKEMEELLKEYSEEESEDKPIAQVVPLEGVAVEAEIPKGNLHHKVEERVSLAMATTGVEPTPMPQSIKFVIR
eukprot:SAG11_NODE_10452_length_831_cov_0.748634_2_plen_97_part_00